MAGKKNLDQSNEPVETPKNTISKYPTGNSLVTTLKGINTEKPSYFEKIDSLSGIDENKLAELQQADLVLVYRDNDRYRAMSDSLKDLVEKKYGGKVYCISIPQGKEELEKNEMELLKNILNTCHCQTDETIYRWTGIFGPQFEHCGNYYEDCKRFLGITEKLEKSFQEKGIDTVYVYISSRDHKGDAMYTCSDHGAMCQRKDGSIYYDLSMIFKDDDEAKEKIDNLKRFWQSRFPNLNVKFIENLHDNYRGFSFSRYGSEGIIFRHEDEYSPEEAIQYIKENYDPNFDINFYKGHELNEENGYKSKGSVLIADRHASSYIKSFKGEIILTAGNNFEPNKGIENFLDENDAQYVQNASYVLAESILLNSSFTLENFKIKIELEK